MQYTEVTLELKPYSQLNAEILTALLAELGFDSFVDSPTGLMAYIPTDHFDETAIKVLFSNLPVKTDVKYFVAHIQDQNWNTKWESNFEAITVENFCRIRAPFHQPEEGFDMEIVIEPKMAFGTGHHQTTWLMIREIFNLDMQQKSVLDMGCGTGLLAIVAEKRGAAKVTAIDNDSWAYENSNENVVANSCTRIRTLLGDATALGSEKYDIILANINLNILMNDLSTYKANLNPKGLLIMSGILTSDIPTISKTAQQHGLTVDLTRSRADWALVLTHAL